MNNFCKNSQSFLPLTIFAKTSILDIRSGSEYASGIFSLLRTKRFAVALMGKLSNCYNGLRRQGVQVNYFLLNQHMQVF